MVKAFHKLLVLSVVLSLLIPVSALAQTTASPAADEIATITVLHTNDFHGNLEPIFSATTKYPGMARVAAKVNEYRTALGADNVVLLDGGDLMQGSLLSNIQKGVPVIDVYNTMGYDAATFGNHEFDWGQTTLISRTEEAAFPFLAANLVSGACTSDNWTPPSFAEPWTTLTVGAPGNQAVLGVIGVTSTETPYITVAEATEGLCFKDAADSILHYYDDIVAAGADAIVVISHLGLEDGGYGYGFPVYGDKTLAGKLNTAGKPVNLIIGGHSHTNVSAATMVGNTAVAQAHSAGRKLGKATLTINKTTGVTTVTWERVLVDANDGSAFTVSEDATIKTLISTYASDPDYLALIDQVVGFSAVDLTRNYNGDNLMGAFVQDAVYNELNSDAEDLNDVDMVFNNPGGLRSDLSTPDATYPYTLTYGMLFSVLPFGNQTVVGDMTGARIMELLNQSASLFKGAIQPAGIEYTFYHYTDTLPGPQPYAWGAYDVQVKNRDTGVMEPIDLTKTYRVATNEFLAPAGQDGFTAFKYMTNISYWGDMLNQVIAWTEATYGTNATAYNGPDGDGTLDGRITRDGDASGGTVVPVTLLHHGDSHGRLLKSGSAVGYTQLATLIKQEKAHNSDRTLLLTAGDNIQGDSMMYFFKSAGLGYSADGVALNPALQTNPLIAAFNAMDYDAMTLGNHEFNFGNDVFTSTLAAANFPMLQANVSDTGEYGLDVVPVEPYTVVTVGPENIDVAVLGIGNHRIPNYELPSNIPGLTFSNPIATAQDLAPDLQAENDVVVALTHIGFTADPKSVEVDVNVDTELAKQAGGIDAILGGHSHTHPANKNFIPDPYQYLPTMEVGPDGEPVIINHTNRYNTFLGEIVLGLLPDGEGGYEVVAQAGRDIEVTSGVVEDPAVKAIVDPYAALLQAYNETVIGQTTAPIDAITAFVEETTGANLQADASIGELRDNGIEVDFHLSGAMTNRAIAPTATITDPVTLKVSDMFTVMPYENSLLVLELNGPQLKQILERAYRNYFYYKYIPGYGGYSYYTTCMIDTNAGNVITYKDTYPALPDGNNVMSLEVGGEAIDFEDAETFYNVSTVNYLAAGSCNFNNNGQTLWPLDQIVADTQYYVRDAVINYIVEEGTVSPAIEGRLQFEPGTAPLLEVTKTGPDYALVGEEIVYTIDYASTSAITLTGVVITDTLPAGLTTTEPTVWDIGDLESGVTGVLTLTATVDPELECGATLTNTVTMAATDGNVSTATIATPAYCAADASFGVSSAAVETGQEVIFTNTSTGSEPLSYLWDFGDGITTTVESPTHAFTNPGNYTVSLTVTNPYSESIAKRVIVVKGYPTIGTLYAPLIFKPTPVE